MNARPSRKSLPRSQTSPYSATLVQSLGGQWFHGTKDLRQIAWSADGHRIAMACGAVIDLWNARTGQKEATLPINRRTVVGMAFDPTGTRLFAASYDRLVAWDLPVKNPKNASLSIKGNFSALALTPNGRTLLTLHAGVVSRWDAATLNAIGSFGDVGRAKNLLYAVGNDHFLVIGNDMFSPDLEIRDLHQGGCVERLRHCNSIEPSVAVSPDGRYVLYAGSGDKWTMKMWDCHTQKKLWEIPAWGKFAVFSADGSRVALGTMPGNTRWVTFYETQTKRKLGEVAVEGNLSTGCFSPDGAQFVAAGPDTRVYLWDTAKFEEAPRGEQHAGAVLGAGFTAHDPTVVTLDTQGGWRWWDLKTGNCGRIGEYRVWTMAVSRTEVAAEAGWFEDKVNGWWNPQTREVVWRPIHEAPWMYRPALAIEGTRMTLAGSNGRDDEALRAQIAPALAKQFPGAQLLGFADSGRQVLLRLGSEIQLLDCATMSPCAVLGDIGPLAEIDEYGTTLLVAGPRSRVRLFSLPDFALLGEGAGPAPGAFSIAIAAQGIRSAVSNRKGTIVVFDRQANPLATLEPVGGKVNSMDFSQDGTRLLAGYDDAMARVWSLAPAAGRRLS